MRPTDLAIRPHRIGCVRDLRSRKQRVPQATSVLAATMYTNPTDQSSGRARRFALHLPVYFRQPQSLTWLEGTTENISYSGVLLRSSYPLAPKTALEMRLQVGVGPEHSLTTEIRCKGTVVRMEQRTAPKTPIALAVAIRDYHIVRRGGSTGGLLAKPENSAPPPKAGRSSH